MNTSDKVIERVVAYLDGALPTLEVEEGFPEWDQDIQNTYNGKVTVHMAAAMEDWRAPGTYLLEDNPTDPNLVDITLLIGHLSCTVQIDLWCLYKAKLRDDAELVGRALHNRLPRETGLYIDMGDHIAMFDRVESVVRQYRENNSAEGNFRRTWSITGHAEITHKVSQPRLNVIDIQQLWEDTTQPAITTTITSE